jgi:CHAD domain-containing protein
MVRATQPSADGKWIAGLTSDTPVTKAARDVLAVRLDAVNQSGRQAVEQFTDPEAVHQLRVATRRARAALAVFADALPRKAVRRGRKTLRKLRRAAGAVRNLDVLLAAVGEVPSRNGPRKSGAMLFLTGYLVARQSAERGRLLRSLNRLLNGKALRRLMRLPGRAHAETNLILGEWASEALDEIVRRFADTLGGKVDEERLHQVRIVGKELRYALEIFIDCYDAEVRDEVYAALEDLQEMLGRANDTRQALRLIEGVTDELSVSRPELDRHIGRHLRALSAALHARLTEQRKKLERWRKQWPRLRAAERLKVPLPSAESDERVE